uniref:Serine/threonine-protein phosphatase 6 regulatory subunit 3-like isoform X5 n=1 Tax=Petromyzon marinus TaxID=7757 RepID=A0AAJ7WZR0_PETMA|nr:serine/threonine-protein phosphatase 6 regulatory subunit 3-like isoform X5 [Petromyzon marinus]
MFWKFDLHTTSHIDTLLEKDDVTLAELMDEDDVLQECKSQNRKLVDFLVHPLAMQELVRLITQEPAEDLDEKIRYKYPNVACELLTADVTQINDRLGDDEALLARLYAFLEQEPPLNPLLASFFSKIMGILISRKTEQIIDFLRKRDDFVGLLLKHIGTSAIMDLLFRLLTCVDPPKLKQDVLNWLNEQRLIQRLIELIHPSQDEDRHSNASQSLCDIIRLSREQISQVQENPEPDPLLTTLEKEETIEQLVSNMFDGEKNESALVNGIQVLLTLLETKRPTLEGQLDLFPQTTERPPVAVSGSTLQGIKARLKDFHALLLEPPKKNAMTTTIGVLEPPLGNTRLHVAKLVSAVLQTNTQALNQQLMQLDTIAVLLDLYFTYVWNNFLHLQVEQAVTTILNNPPSTEESGDGPGTEDGVDVRRENASLFQRCQLVQRMLGAWESNEKEQEEGGRRRGYMGHLTRIANAVVQSAEKGPNALLIKELLTELPDDYRERWDVFVGSALVDINKKNTVDLVRSLVSPYNQHSSSEDDDADIKDIGFPPDASLQQAFSDYQMQQMTSNFVDQFGFSDEEFAEQEDNVNASFDRVSEINFAINANDESQNAALFEACCNERIQQFDDESGADEEDIWEEKQITYATNVKVRQRFGVLYSTSNTGKTSGDSGGSEESTDSEEDVEEEDVSVKPCRHSANNNNAEDRMDVDGADASGPGWTARFDDVAMDTGGGASADGDLAGRAGDSSSTSSSSSSSPAVVDTGSSLWENAGGSPGPGQQGLSWADFPDTKPKTSSLSVTGPRSSSPIAMETGPDTTDHTNKHAASQTADLPPVVQQQQKPEGGSSSNSSLHTARAVAPGVPSDDDNSSSGGSDSDDHEEVAAAAAVGASPSSSSAPGGAASSAGSRPGGCVVTETITTGSVQETVCLTMDAKSETAVFKRCRIFRSTCRCSDAADVVSSDDVPITEMSLSGSESPQSPVAQPSRTTGPADRSSPGHEEPGKDLAIAVPVENGPLEEVLPETLPRPEPLAAGEVMTSVSSA